MSVALTKTPRLDASAVAADPHAFGLDQWVCVPASWELYMGLQQARGEKSRPRYTFIDGWLTIVSPGLPHELTKVRLGSLIQEILIGLSISYVPIGRTTLLASKDPRVGTEGDDSYYLTNIESIARKQDLFMDVDPPPDLVVEVVVSHPEDDSLKVYARFGVREVWVHKKGRLEFLVLRPDGQYSPSPTSSLLPFLSSEELIPWISRRDPSGDTKMYREFRTWVTESLLPRHRPVPDA